MIAAFLAGLLKANLAASAAVLAVLALRRPVRNRFGARAAYALWIAPLLCAAAVFAPHTPVPASDAQRAWASAAELVVAAPQVTSPRLGLDPALLVFAPWLVGAAAMAALMFRRQTRFTAAMRPLRPAVARGVFRAARNDVGPAVVGAFRPRIVAPADFESRFAPHEQALILAHERAHLAGGDAAINALACAIQCLCWFNPLAPVAARKLRVDQELACDATVVGHFPEVRRAYAELLLKTQLTSQVLPIGCHWPARAEHPLKERIAMLRCPLPGPALRAWGGVAAVTVSAVAAGLAWASQPAPVASSAASVSAIATGEIAVVQQVAAAAQAVVAPRTRSPASGAALIAAPDWIQKPGAADVATAYPVKADQDRIGGAATLACKFAQDGRLVGCRVVSETPPEDGFGAAALKLAPLFRAAPLSRDGVPVAGAEVRIPIRFMWPGRPTESMAAAGEPLVTRPDWLKKPTPADLARFYPAEAERLGLRARVTLDCTIGADGRMATCGVVSSQIDDPAYASQDFEMDFGTAALQMALIFQTQPTAADGAPVAGRHIRIPIVFALPKASS